MNAMLDTIASYAAERVREAKNRISFEQIKDAAQSLPPGGFRFEQALRAPGVAFICEVKKASPSKGVIDPEFDYMRIAMDYQASGADCVSCLTEPKWFLGSDEIFKEIRSGISLPMLRKDFTVDAYQLYEAKCLGADAVLLICALLDTEKLAEYIAVCDRLGLSALVETHNEKEITGALDSGARLIGVNNPNLRDISVDIATTAKLRTLIPSGVLLVSESGIKTPEDVTAISALGVDAVLVGESMMRAPDKKTLLAAFREASK
jgi:indole-3-glycerol phosphate synthase